MFRVLIPVLLLLPPSGGRSGEKTFLDVIGKGLARVAAGKPGEAAVFFGKAREEALRSGAPGPRLSLLGLYATLSKPEAGKRLAAWKKLDALGRSYREGKGKLPEVLSLLEEARRARDPVLRIKAANLAGVIATDRCQFERGARLYEEALEEAERFHLGGLAAAVQANRGRQALARGDYKGALEILEPVLPSLEEESDPFLAALLHHHLAASLVEMGKDRDALEHLARSEDLFRRAGRPGRAFLTAVEKVRLLFGAGKRSEAAAEMEKLLASPLARRDKKSRLALASLLVSSLAPGGAGSDRFLESLARAAGRVGLPEYELGFLLCRVQGARRSGNFRKAEKLLQEAGRSAGRIGSAWASCRVLLARARLAKAEGKGEEARRAFLALAGEEGGKVPPLLRALALAGLGRMAAREGKNGEAAEYFRKAAEIEGGKGEVFRQANLLALAAGRLFAAGRDREGKALALRALDLLPRARRRSPNWGSGLSILGKKAGVFELLLAGVLEGKGGDPNRSFAFSLAEKLKAGGLYDRILKLERTGGSGPRPLHMLAILERRIRTLKEARSAPGLLRRLEARKAEILCLGNLPEPGDEGAPRAVSLEELRRSIPPGLTVLFFHVGSGRSGLWLVRKEKVLFRKLPGKRALSRKTERFRVALSSLPGFGWWRVVWREGRKALDFLLGDLARAIPPGSRVVLVPGAGLEDFPFPALVTGPGSLPAGPGEIRFLGPDSRISFTRIPSATLLVHFLRKKREKGGGKALLVEGDGGSRLPGVRRELAAVRTILGRERTLLAGGREAFSLLERGGRSWSILHLAGHAEQAGDSGAPRLFLGGTALTPEKILGWGLGPAFVNLSACRTGMGHALPLEGRAGFARSFLASGTRRVLLSAWDLQDEAAVLFNRAFYEALARGASIPRALCSARRILRQDSRFEAPFFWAPYQLFGSP